MKGAVFMLRMAVYAVAALAMCASVLVADDGKHAKGKGDNGLHAMFVKADVTKNTITFKTTDKAGKTVETTLALAKDAKVLGEDNKPESLVLFAKNMQKEKDKSILIMEDKSCQHVVEIRDLPSR
jgi:hypothetical protein